MQNLEDAINSGQKVKIGYVQTAGGKFLGSWPWRGKTNYFIQSVEPLNTQK